ncbi:hypothetical protein EDD21DRAFT_403001 [Dissophora ornata]|nr:hypothetical protein EDD21DRAFT_403001 [Dissophora ornata]
MAVQPYPMSHHRGMHTNTTTSSIQPSVKTILDLARVSEQHIVRLYYLPTSGTNGFTTTHTLVFPSPEDRYPETSSVTNRNRSNTYHFGGSTRHRRPAPVRDRPQRLAHLTRISESERGIVHLSRLRISTVIIATSSLPYLTHLVSLRLQGNQLTDLPLQIFRLPSLRELDVSQNLLTEISPLIGLLAPTLEELFLQSNRLQSLPQQLGQLKRLRLLDIADNHLGCIPVEVQRLVSESFASERRSLWRLNESVLSLDTGSDDMQQAHGEGSSRPSHSPVEQHPGQGVLNAPNEDGGHDDDDYVQIRQGMKCWARGNRFWQRQHHHNHNRQQPHPEHLVDQRGYSKDSYTSCSWTLSLVDICSQIVGERLHDDPHYFCHSSTCPFKKNRKVNRIQSSIPPPPAEDNLRNEPPGNLNEEQVDGCTVMMMPEWMTEQLGLHRLSELRKSLHGSCNIDQESDGDWSDGWEDTTKNASNIKNKPGLLEVPAPMQLTLQERETESEFCSVCHKRLYFAGMRWKGVGVMDERIVPLEWVACSVQCRVRAERGDRRDHSHNNSGNGVSSAEHPLGVSFDIHGTPSRESDSTAGSDYGGDDTEGFLNGVQARVNHESQLFSPAMPPSITETHQDIPRSSPVAVVVDRVRQTVQNGDRDSPQREYRETVLYGLIKSRALRRRTRALSL